MYVVRFLIWHWEFLCFDPDMKTTLRKWWAAIAGAIVISAFLVSCVTNEAGRKQLMLVSSSQVTQLGLSSFDQLKTNTPINKDPEINNMVRRVGERIKSVVTLPNAQWEFVVFESKEANAFCLPGGKIGVYTGILPITKDEEGLATVLGHEVAHATLEHGRERMSRGMALNVIGQGLGSVVNATDPRWTSAFGQLYGIGSQVGLELPHSRSQESEADHRGLIYMAKAGYNPEASVAFWERFAAYIKQAGGNSTPSFLRTHPLDDVRIKQLKEWLPEAKAVYKPR
jgi:predicted Zn-dependent protease